jgi:hypothetical protein
MIWINISKQSNAVGERWRSESLSGFAMRPR